MDKLCQCHAILCESIYKPGGKDVQIIRAAVVEYIPDDLHIVLTGGIQHGNQGGEIELPAALDQRPAGSIPHGTDVYAAQQFVVRCHLDIMLGKSHHIQPQPGSIDVTGRFKACQKERIKQAQIGLRKQIFLLPGKNIPFASGSLHAWQPYFLKNEKSVIFIAWIHKH
jgi:hypothetical protein